jgi:hypothetical protein
MCEILVIIWEVFGQGSHLAEESLRAVENNRKLSGKAAEIVQETGSEREREPARCRRHEEIGNSCNSSPSLSVCPH